MNLKKVSKHINASYLYLTKTEIFTIDWSDKSQLIYYVIDSSKIAKKVSRDYFALNVIGKSYKDIEKHLTRPFEYFNITKDKEGNVCFLEYMDSKLLIFNQSGKKVFDFEIEYGNGHVIYDIQFESPDFIWLAFPTGQTVSKFSIKARKEVFKIGCYTYDDDNYELLAYPESIFIKENDLFIPNMANKKLFIHNLKNESTKLITTFNEPLWQFVSTDFGYFAVTDSGLYEVCGLNNL